MVYLNTVWPTRADLEAEIEGFFLPGNNQEWARAQLLCLRQGPRQCMDEFLVQFEALKIQSCCVDDYARDLLKRVLKRKLLEQIYIQNMQHDTYARLSASAREIGRVSRPCPVPVARLVTPVLSQLYSLIPALALHPRSWTRLMHIVSVKSVLDPSCLPNPV